MRFNKFTFSKIDKDYGGFIFFEINGETIEIEDTHIGESLTALLDGIANCWSDKKQLVQVQMHSETTYFDFILIAFPSEFLKIEIYEDFTWELYRSDMDTPPPPVLSGFFDFHEFAFLVHDEIIRQGEAAFVSSRYPYPAAALERLYKLMV